MLVNRQTYSSVNKTIHPTIHSVGNDALKQKSAISFEDLITSRISTKLEYLTHLKETIKNIDIIKKMKRIIFLITLLFVVILFGQNLNPFSNSMFIFHDETQPARIQQFVLALKNGQFPPRFAPDFSFKMSYPVFNFYAPTSYWLTSMFVFIGIDIVNALKLSFLLTILIGFIGTYLLLKEYFDFFPSLTGAVLYISSLYYPLDIFVRGNLAEVWFLALFPLTFFCIKKNAKKSSPFFFFISIIFLSLLFTTHNLLSLISIPLILIFIFLHSHKKINLIAFFLAIMLSSYFIIPMILENHLTYATYIATLTKYADHFVCPYQLWQSDWGFGGSTKGCIDGMSFKIGKPQIIFTVMGIVLFFWNLKNKEKNKKYFIFYTLYFLLLFSGSLFMSTYLSKIIWDLFSPLLAIFQFPWRFLAFSLIGIAFLSSYFFHNLNFPLKNIFLIGIIITVFIISTKYFSGITIPKKQFEKQYLSQEYIEKKAAYHIAEYLPKTADYNSWRKYENSSSSPEPTLINIHYFPFWTIIIDGKKYQPTHFDHLGRPIVPIKKYSKINLQYKETLIEKLGNLITIITFCMVILIINNQKIWKKIRT